jgi:winged helix-turn helix protein
MNVRYRVELSQAERGELTAMLSKGKRAARKLKRAQILLAADAGHSDEEIARTVAVGGSTVYRTKRRFVEGNLERALSEDPRPGVNKRPRLTPPSLGRSIAWLADRRRDPTPINSDDGRD